MGLYFLSLFLLSHLPECACYSLVIIYPFSFYRFTLYEHGNSVYCHGTPYTITKTPSKFP